jgi:hypothetical protein
MCVAMLGGNTMHANVWNALKCIWNKTAKILFGHNLPNELWCVHVCVTTVTFELVIDGFGDKRLGSVNVQ